MRVEWIFNCLPWSFDQYRKKWQLLLEVMVTTHVSGVMKYVTLTSLRTLFWLILAIFLNKQKNASEINLLFSVLLN